MTQAVAYGYARYITDVESAKPEALRSLGRGLAKFGAWPVGDDGQARIVSNPLPVLPDHEIDESNVEFTPYRHGGLHLQATYHFDHPEAS